MYSKIIKNGTVVDGTGKKAFVADIAIEQDKIVQIGDTTGASAQEVIDATGKYVAPGFVDIQNHSDVYWTLFDSPSMDSLLAQGITTAIIGNCGASLAPLLTRDALLSVQKWHSLEGVNFNWASFEEYLKELSKRKFGVNIASLIGYSTLRRGILKDEHRPLTVDEFKIVAKALEQSFKAGAFGVSSGLSYAHEAAASENEIIEVAKIVKKFDGLYSLHLRSESTELTESVAEALDIATKTGVNMKLSHFKVRQKENWHLLPHALNLIEAAYQKGIKVFFDVYPYDFVWQVLYTYLPRWSYEGGRQVMLSHLKDPVQRKKIKDYLASKDIDYNNILVASTTLPLNVAGKTLGEIARRQEVDVKDALIDLVANGGSEILVFDRNLDEKQVDALLGHVLSMVATDGAGFAPKLKDRLVHPRSFGSMPKFLKTVFEKKVCTLEQAIQKISGTPAQRVGLKDRGTLEIGKFADVVIFDGSIDSLADAIDPYRPNKGIEHVLVNGKTAFEHGIVSTSLAGKVLRRE